MTLTELSVYSRRMLPFLIIFCLIILIFFYAFKLLFLYLGLQQSTTVYTNPIFNKIKAPAIVSSSTSAQLNFSLDTIEGQPINATQAAKVYFLPPSSSKFTFLQQIYLMAKAVGINTDIHPHSLNGTEAVFDDGSQKLKVDVTNYNFSYEYQLSQLKNDPAFTGNAVVPQKKDIEEKAANFLSSLGRYPDELVTGKKNILYLRYDPATNILTMDENLEKSNMVEVDFYRSDIDGMPIVSPKYFNSQNYVIIAFGQDTFKVIKAQVEFFEKSTDQVGIYPLKTGTVAWDELKANKGSIISKEGSSSSVVIKKMFLGYYDPDAYQDYLQPVYVFLGDNNFVGYVPAVSTSYLAE
jgi:hypothetical protein